MISARSSAFREHSQSPSNSLIHIPIYPALISREGTLLSSSLTKSVNVVDMFGFICVESFSAGDAPSFVYDSESRYTFFRFVLVHPARRIAVIYPINTKMHVDEILKRRKLYSSHKNTIDTEIIIITT